MQIDILKDWGDVLAVDKPAGWLSIPGRGNKAETPVVSNILGAQLRQGQKQIHRDLFVVHRLDAGTSGVMLFAKTSEAHKDLSQLFLEGKIKKKYWAIVKGEIKDEISIDAPLLKLPSKKNKSIVDPKGKPSQTIINPLGLFSGCTLVEAQPLTGRTHQIRVHLAHIKFPLLGDILYGGPPEAFGIKFLQPLLHSRHIAFEYPENFRKEAFSLPQGAFLDAVNIMGFKNI